jgi:hypothetical protein
MSRRRDESVSELRWDETQKTESIIIRDCNALLHTQNYAILHVRFRFLYVRAVLLTTITLLTVLELLLSSLARYAGGRDCDGLGLVWGLQTLAFLCTEPIGCHSKSERLISFQPHFIQLPPPLYSTSKRISAT